MLNSANISTVLTSAENSCSNSLLAQSQALFQLNFLGGSGNPFRNATTFSSSSSSAISDRGLHENSDV